MIGGRVISSRIPRTKKDDGDCGGDLIDCGGGDDDVERQEECPHFMDSEALKKQICRKERSLISLQKLGDLPEEATLCNNIAKLYEMLGDWPRALEYHHYDGQICECVGDVEGWLVAHSNQIELFDKLKVPPSIHKRWLDDHLRIAKEHQLPQEIYQSHYLLANHRLLQASSSLGKSIEVLKKEYLDQCELAIADCKQSLAFFEEGESGSSDSPKLLANYQISCLEAKVLMERENFEGALRMLQRALFLCKKCFCVDGEDDFFMEQFNVFDMIGNCHLALNDPEAAIERAFDKQLAFCRQQKLPKSYYRKALRNLARAYTHYRDYALAEQTIFLLKDDQLDSALSGEEECYRRQEDAAMLADILRKRDLLRKISALERKRRNGVNEPEDAPSQTPPPLSRHEQYKLSKYLFEMKLYKECTENVKEYSLAHCKGTGKDDAYHPKILEMATVSAMETGEWEDALYHCNKLYNLQHEGGGIEGIVDATLLMANVCTKSPTLQKVTDWPALIKKLEDALELLSSHRSRQQSASIDGINTNASEGNDMARLSYLQICSQLASIHSNITNDPALSTEYTNRCISVLSEQDALPRSKQKESDATETLNQLDYFVGRGASKSLLKMVDGSFVMKSRSGRKAIRGVQPSTKTTSKKSFGNKSSNKGDGRSSKRKDAGHMDDDLDGFIVDDDCGLQQERELKRHGKKRQLQRKNEKSNRSTEIINLENGDRGKDGERAREVLVRTALAPTNARHPPNSNDTIIRIHCHFDTNKTLLIPLIQDISNSKQTIAWLATQLSQRYLDAFGRQPIIRQLYTVHGGGEETGDRSVLGMDDSLFLLLSDQDRVFVETGGWKSIALHRHYEDLCREGGLAPIPSLYQTFKDFCDGAQNDHCDFSFFEYGREQFCVCLRVLCMATTLGSLDISNNALVVEDDDIASMLGDAADGLGDRLKALNCSFCNLQCIRSSRSCKLHTLDCSFNPNLSELALSQPAQERVSDGGNVDATPLKIVNLSGTDLTLLNVQDLFSTAHTLILDFCRIDAQSIARSIQYTDTLHTLSLSHCTFTAINSTTTMATNDSLYLIARALAINHSLRSVILCGYHHHLVDDASLWVKNAFEECLCSAPGRTIKFSNATLSRDGSSGGD